MLNSEKIVTFDEIDSLYKKYTDLVDNELTKSHLDVEMLQFYSGARTALFNLKKAHEGAWKKEIKASDPLYRMTSPPERWGGNSIPPDPSLL